MRRQRGFSLLELSVSLVVLGLVALLILRFLGQAQQEQRGTAQRELLQRADDALLAFAMINSRLPCPAAAGGNGEEDCGLGQVGVLPYRSLGLPDLGARRVRYGVLRRAASEASDDADLAVSRDRFQPLAIVAQKSYIAMPTTYAHVNGLDLCQALRTATRLAPDAGYLHTTLPAQPGTLGRHIAYAVALPGDGAFGGQQASTSPAFDSPQRASTPDFRDQVLAVGNEQLWARMRCGDNLSAGGHAHFNAALAASMLRTALYDYKQQLAVSKKLAEANVASAAAAILGGAAATADSAGGTADTASESLASTGAMSWRVSLAAIATAGALAVTVTAAALQAQAVKANDQAKQAYEDVEPLITEADLLQPLVLEQAQADDATGMY
ncbi:prepilin-type N-terminal cleavage/methylation domain-containing protein [Stenotrophomonas sp. HITSZ_GD]|uniref:prepilin-type N-terminal cleavage/methylation domain-containing protein n=1 Tax=Stenotrophomonas sp. HITSZ_GD TaxID=3037248 RepID=UPI00240CE80F|nr:prepilin-type N-terminal cleavage/methylation domain-containing protein [Stenotrophomonas sp. HITSZ_GD]MDG2526194.1 prepilin-type N-terminal cleavage/methylation domain-containing protein [Stenotrophomonas sp. HITSZ_GD]